MKRPHLPHGNILVGAAYLFELHAHYGAAGFPAAYNAGPACDEEHLASGWPLSAETRACVAVLAHMSAGEQVCDAMFVAVTARSSTEAPLFTVRAENRLTDAQPTSGLCVSCSSTGGAVADVTALVAI